MRTAVYALTPEHVWTQGFCNVIFFKSVLLFRKWQ